MSLFAGIINRRQMLRVSAALAGASILPRSLKGSESGNRAFYRRPLQVPGAPDQRYPFTLPDLPYASDGLEAAIDAQTMEIHHGRHHDGYVSKLNAALEGHGELHGLSLVELVGKWDGLPAEVQVGVRNSGGGHMNHALFWPALSPSGGGQAEGALGRALRDRFGSFQAFREQFSQASGSVFGSGWGWLVATPAGNLDVTTTPNQDNPVSRGMTPLLGIDVWEHAYYLRYQNRRGDYIQAFWDVVDWGEVGRRFEAL